MMRYHLSVSKGWHLLSKWPTNDNLGLREIAKITCSCQQSQLASQELQNTPWPPQEGVKSIKAHYHINHGSPKVADKWISRNTSKNLRAKLTASSGKNTYSSEG